MIVILIRDLGREKSFIELDTPNIPCDKLEELERDVNDAIRRCIPMTPRLVELGSKELEEVFAWSPFFPCVPPVRVWNDSYFTFLLNERIFFPPASASIGNGSSHMPVSHPAYLPTLNLNPIFSATLGGS